MLTHSIAVYVTDYKLAAYKDEDFLSLNNIFLNDEALYIKKYNPGFTERGSYQPLSPTPVRRSSLPFPC